MAWNLVGNIKGPTGATGSTGSTGATGSTGPTGPAGVAPTGAIVMWSGASVPSGYLACDGSAVSRSTYAALFAVMGTRYGVGDGSTTFNLPGLQASFPLGTAVGATPGSGGTSIHGHSVSGTHTHPLSDNGKANIGPSGNSVIVRRVTGSYTSTFTFNPTQTQTTSTATSTLSVGLGGATDAASSGNTDNITTLPPWVGVLYVVKT